jgi:hypothetical protein
LSTDDSIRDLIAGGVTTVNRAKEMSAEGKRFRDEEIPKLIANVWGERFGPSSWFRKALLGKISTMDIKVCHKPSF